MAVSHWLKVSLAIFDQKFSHYPQSDAFCPAVSFLHRGVRDISTVGFGHIVDCTTNLFGWTWSCGADLIYEIKKICCERAMILDLKINSD